MSTVNIDWWLGKLLHNDRVHPQGGEGRRQRVHGPQEQHGPGAQREQAADGLLDDELVGGEGQQRGHQGHVAPGQVAPGPQPHERGGGGVLHQDHVALAARADVHPVELRAASAHPQQDRAGQ